MVARKETSKLDRSRMKLSVTVAQADVKKEYDAFVAEFSKSMQLPGFRKGKVPLSVLETKFGKELRSEALGRILEKAAEEALEGVEDKPLPYARPSIEEELELDLGKDLSFTLVYDVFPEVKVEGYEGVEIEVPEATVADADINREIEAIRERNAIVADKGEGAACAKDDIVTLDYAELGADGEEIPGSKREGFVFAVGSGYNLYKFDDEVVGMKKGDSKAITKEFPADYEYKELAGKKVKLQVAVTQVKAKKLPAVDDELAQDVSEKFKTLADLKADIRSHLELAVQDKLRDMKVAAIVEKLIERNPLELPESMVAVELSGRWDSLRERVGAQSDERMNQFLRMSGKTRDQILGDWKPHSEKALKARLIIERLIEKEKLEASDEEIEAEIARVAERAKVAPETIKERMENPQEKFYLVESVKERKLYEKLIAAAKAKKGKKIPLEELFKAEE